MPDFPNLLRQRLACSDPARAYSGSHPDADTLTAYAEQLLPARERRQVLEHLSACGECREVVALSLPELEAAAPIAVTVVPAAGRFAWTKLMPRLKLKWRPSLGLAAMAAVVIVASLIF